MELRRELKFLKIRTTVVSVGRVAGTPWDRRLHEGRVEHNMY